MNSNIEGIFQALIPQRQQGTQQSSAVVTERTVTATNQSSPQYVINNEQPSFAAKPNESNFVGSPRIDTKVDGERIGGNDLYRTNENKSGITTTYYNSSTVSPVPTRTYQFSSSTFQSPDHNITAFNERGNNPSSTNQVTTRTVTYTGTVRQNNASQEVDSTSQVQRQLYKRSPLIQNGSANETYEYKKIITGNGKGMNNNESVSPVNNLLDGNFHGAERRFFENYSGGNQAANFGKQLSQTITFDDNTGQNLQRAQSVTESIYEYHPIRATGITTGIKLSSPVVSFTSGGNRLKQSFESHSFNTGYKPSSGNKVTFGNLNAVVNGSAPSYSNGEYSQGNIHGTTYHYVSSKPQGISTYNSIRQDNQYNLGNNYTTETVQTIPIPQIITQTHSKNPQSTYHSQKQQFNQQTRIENTKKTSQMYQVVDQIERPLYQKLYGLEDTYGRRMIVEQDPPTNKGCCGPLCWLPLVLIGAILGLFGMLCGLSVVCPGSGNLKTVQTVTNVLVEPSVVANTTQPQKVIPTVPLIPPPQTITPSILQPVSQPSFTPGTPGYQTITPSYVPPISVAPSANPTAPIVPNITVPIELSQYNATVQAITEPVVQIQPEVTTYDKKIDEYTIDATPQIVGVVTNGNTEVLDDKVNVQGVGTYIDYTTSNASGMNQNFGSVSLVAPIDISPSVMNTTTMTNITSSTITQPQSTFINVPLINNNSQAMPAVIDNGWIEPFSQVTNTVTNTTMTSSGLSETNSIVMPAVTVSNGSMFGQVTPQVQISNAQTKSVDSDGVNSIVEAANEGNGFITTEQKVVISGKSEASQDTIDTMGQNINGNAYELNEAIEISPFTIVTTTQAIPTANPTTTPDFTWLQPAISPSTTIASSQKSDSPTTPLIITANDSIFSTASPIIQADVTSSLDVISLANSTASNNNQIAAPSKFIVADTLTIVKDLPPVEGVPSNFVQDTINQMNANNDVIHPVNTTASNLYNAVLSPSTSTVLANLSSSNDETDFNVPAPEFIVLEPLIQASSVGTTQPSFDIQPIIPSIQLILPTIA